MSMSGRKHQGTTHNVATFSSHSLGSYASSERTIPHRGHLYFGFGNQAAPGLSMSSSVPNRSLLEPLQLDLDKNIRAIKVQEMEQIKSLNDRFASFINKVSHLEQQNKMLETKLQLLQSGAQTESNMEPVFQMYIRTLRSQLNTLSTSKEHLNAELRSVYSLVEENKNRYEAEINKRYEAENDFVLLKKDVDTDYFVRINLEAQLSAIRQGLDFFKALHEKEVQELKEQLKDTSVVVEMDNSRQLNMEQVVKEVKARYEDVSARSREEAEDWYRNKFELVSTQVDHYSSDLKYAKNEISKLKRQITKLQADITHVKAEIEEAEHRGKETVFGAKQNIKDLETALQKAKNDITRQVREYQELMNIRLALDLEIATYKKLLEGEENRTGRESIIRVRAVPKPIHPEHVTNIPCTKVFFRMIGPQENNIISVKD